MTPNDPRHGQNRGYYAHIAAGQEVCGPCREAAKRHRRRRGKLRTMGVPGRLPIGAKLHARLLRARDRGFTHQQIADAIGVSLSCAWRYCEEGPDHLVSLETWRKLAAFRPGTVLTYVGMIRRIQALHHMGYGCAAIARESGCHRETLQEAVRGRAFATARLKQAIADAYDRLWDVPCTDSARVTSRAKSRAVKMGWPGALAWDDDSIDDPNARPEGMSAKDDPAGYDESRIERRINGDRNVRLHKGESVEVVRRLLAEGLAQNEIRRRTGLKPERYTHLIRAQAPAREAVKAA